MLKAAVTALATKSIATNSRPLARKTVAKNLSSAWPMRSRTTPDEPEKGDSSEGYEVGREDDQSPPRRIGGECSGIVRIGCQPPESERGREQDRK